MKIVKFSFLLYASFLFTAQTSAAMEGNQLSGWRSYICAKKTTLSLIAAVSACLYMLWDPSMRSEAEIINSLNRQRIEHLNEHKHIVQGALNTYIQLRVSEGDTEGNCNALLFDRFHNYLLSEGVGNVLYLICSGGCGKTTALFLLEDMHFGLGYQGDFLEVLKWAREKGISLESVFHEVTEAASVPKLDTKILPTVIDTLYKRLKISVKNRKGSNYIPLLIPLAKVYPHCGTSNKLIHCFLRNFRGLKYSEIEMTKEWPFLFLLDGLDEINKPVNLYKRQDMKEWKKAKSIITSRQVDIKVRNYEFIQSSEGITPWKIFACKFDESQMKKFIENFSQTPQSVESWGSKKYQDLSRDLNKLIGIPDDYEFLPYQAYLHVLSIGSSQIKRKIDEDDPTAQYDYQAFFDTNWKAREIKRKERMERRSLTTSEEAAFSEQITNFYRSIAAKMFETSVSQFRRVPLTGGYYEEYKDWKPFFKNPLMISAPIYMTELSVYKFYSDGFYRYLVASLIVNEIHDNSVTKSIDSSLIAKRVFTAEDTQVLNHISYLISSDRANLRRALLQTFNLLLREENKSKGSKIVFINTISIINNYYNKIGEGDKNMENFVRRGAFKSAFRDADLSVQDPYFAYRGPVLVNADLELFDFSNSNMRGTNFSGSGLENAKFEGTKLDFCDLTGARISPAKRLQINKDTTFRSIRGEALKTFNEAGALAG